jgi:hypothetical protein
MKEKIGERRQLLSSFFSPLLRGRERKKTFRSDGQKIGSVIRFRETISTNFLTGLGGHLTAKTVTLNQIIAALPGNQKLIHP